MKFFFMAAAMFGTITYGTTDLFQRAQVMTEGVGAVYVAASDINHFADTNTRTAQQQNLYVAAANLAPIAEEVTRDAAEAFEVAQAEAASYNPYDAYRSR